MRYSIVIPSLGRASLPALLAALAGMRGPAVERVVVVDDRPTTTAEPVPPLRIAVAQPLRDRLIVACSHGRGPAAARNVGWRAVDSPWVVFVDDDVTLHSDWALHLERDLRDLGPEVAGCQARVHVPRPVGRRLTDWERSTAGLADACWITAEMAYRRTALVQVDGFDERFTRAYREDCDLALRVLAAGHQLVVGAREVVHRVRPADRWVSVRAQAGNSDDVLMRRKHGPSWRERAAAPAGERPRHLVSVAAGAAGLLGALGARPRLRLTGAALWLGLTSRFALSRITPGPRNRHEVVTMLATSAAIPPAAAYHWLRGHWEHRAVRPWRCPPKVVLFDRDGTLVEDVPYNGSPERVRPVPGARAALDRLRERGILVGVVTNQSGLGRGLLTPSAVDLVNLRIAELLGPFDAWAVCPHLPGDGCGCRKPAPGLIHQILDRLGMPAEQCAVVGDIGADQQAALAAGARGVLVPNSATRPAEVRAAPEVAADLSGAVDLLLGREEEAR